MIRIYPLLFIIMLVIKNSFSQSCSPDQLQVYQVTAHQTDNNISTEVEKHFAYVNTSCDLKNLLLLFLVGTNAAPASVQYFPELVANNGYHVINLKYPNNVSAQTPCRNSPDVDCYENFRKEILEGINYSAAVNVDTANCVYNRLLKLLIYLNDQHPQEGWDHYFSGNTLQWNHILVAGHSQGGGHAAMIAKDHKVKRVVMFASPNDYSDFFGGPALWTTKPHLTATGSYFAFGNVTDEIVDFTEQYQQWNALGLDNFGDTVFTDANLPPYSNSHELYTSYDPPGNNGNHNSVVVDSWTPLNSDDSPQFEPVWRYMMNLPIPRPSYVSTSGYSLGINPASALRNENQMVFNQKINYPVNFFLFDLSGHVLIRSPMSEENDIRSRLSQLPFGCYCFHMVSDGQQYSGILFLPLN